MNEERKCVYLIRFITSEKGYVGQTKDFKSRMKQHQAVNSGCRYLKHAMAFYGFDDCEVYILEDDLTIEEANAFETMYIRELGTLVPNGYNLNEGGNCQTMLQETKDLLAESARSRWQDPEFREKQLALMRTEEYREKHRINTTKLWNEDVLYQQKVADGFARYWSVEENLEANRQRALDLWNGDTSYRQKVSDGLARYWAVEEHMEEARRRAHEQWKNQEFREKTSAACREACNTDEMKETRRSNAKTLWADDEFRAKQMETRQSEEFKEKMSASLNTEEHRRRKADIRLEKSTRCREAFVRLEGDTQKVAEELNTTKWTIATWLKPYENDEEIIVIKKRRRKILDNTPEMKEKKKKAAMASIASKRSNRRE
jgi:group I intron endonuclease